jgi:hypothetical protein
VIFFVKISRIASNKIGTDVMNKSVPAFLNSFDLKASVNAL